MPTVTKAKGKTNTRSDYERAAKAAQKQPSTSATAPPDGKKSGSSAPATASPADAPEDVPSEDVVPDDPTDPDGYDIPPSLYVPQAG